MLQLIFFIGNSIFKIIPIVYNCGMDDKDT